MLVGHLGIRPWNREYEAESGRMGVSSIMRIQGDGDRIFQTNVDFFKSRLYNPNVPGTVDFFNPALDIYHNNG